MLARVCLPAALAGGCPTLTNMLVIIVGGIPIAMPTVLSVTLALGAFVLAKEGAIVSRMSGARRPCYGLSCGHAALKPALGLHCVAQS
jgi:hypothetical protein